MYLGTPIFGPTTYKEGLYLVIQFYSEPVILVHLTHTKTKLILAVQLTMARFQSERQPMSPNQISEILYTQKVQILLSPHSKVHTTSMGLYSIRHWIYMVLSRIKKSQYLLMITPRVQILAQSTIK